MATTGSGAIQAEVKPVYPNAGRVAPPRPPAKRKKPRKS